MKRFLWQRIQLKNMFLSQCNIQMNNFLYVIDTMAKMQSVIFVRMMSLLDNMAGVVYRSLSSKVSQNDKKKYENKVFRISVAISRGSG